MAVCEHEGGTGTQALANRPDTIKNKTDKIVFNDRRSNTIRRLKMN
jgi:hypothetical protein